jgi:hypothetical protein
MVSTQFRLCFLALDIRMECPGAPHLQADDWGDGGGPRFWRLGTGRLQSCTEETETTAGDMCTSSLAQCLWFSSRLAETKLVDMAKLSPTSCSAVVHPTSDTLCTTIEEQVGASAKHYGALFRAPPVSSASEAAQRAHSTATVNRLRQDPVDDAPELGASFLSQRLTKLCLAWPRTRLREQMESLRNC